MSGEGGCSREPPGSLVFHARDADLEVVDEPDPPGKPRWGRRPQRSVLRVYGSRSDGSDVVLWVDGVTFTFYAEIRDWDSGDLADRFLAGHTWARIERQAMVDRRPLQGYRGPGYTARFWAVTFACTRDMYAAQKFLTELDPKIRVHECKVREPTVPPDPLPFPLADGGLGGRAPQGVFTCAPTPLGSGVWEGRLDSG